MGYQQKGLRPISKPEPVESSRLPDPATWLPEFPCEIPGLKKDDPRNGMWKMGEYKDGVDNVDREAGLKYGGIKQWEGDAKPEGYTCPEWAQKVFDVPHMPGQPQKEMLARMKASDPRPFQDKFFTSKYRDLPQGWEYMLKGALRTEEFGINSAEDPAEWAGQEPDCVPEAVCAWMHPSQTDTCTVRVGRGIYKEKNETAASKCDGEIPDVPEVPGAEFDYLEYLYAKDQEGKCIQIQKFVTTGLVPNEEAYIHFVPPKGTKTITPYACFKIRGAWKGATLDWNPSIENPDMHWFTEMPPAQRRELAEYAQLDKKSKKEVDSLRFSKTRKRVPKLWPEGSYEDNMGKAQNTLKNP